MDESNELFRNKVKPPETPEKTNDLSLKEAQAFEDRNYFASKRDFELKQNQSIQRHINRALIAAIWVGFAFLLLFSFTWVWHKVLPWPWFEEAQIQTVNTMFTGGLISTLLTIAANSMRKRKD
jgi:hypothetical protein